MQTTANRLTAATPISRPNLLSFRKDVSFAARATLTRYLAQVPDHATLIIDAQRADFVDRDVRDTL
ncbi:MULTISPECIES: hypothetical protein [Mycetohabitans]|uniref:hypothetical protein n=1 Tax=Mycetohabitans TaxID=2571159 RepID=UPI000975A26F|nr:MULTISPECIES: hypothetical protein [Burkholderiaceae]MCF2133619.1 hypothetical protein [Mycetohabitans sp. B3]MCG1039171.1 hypothetical protein [Mycetohabitans sp. B7]